MIILDTNVVFEAMKPSANPAVMAWLNRQAAETLYLSSVTLAELLFGIDCLPEGRRNKAIRETLDGLLDLFGDRILSFDTKSARNYAQLAAKVRSAKMGFPLPDCYIAAIAVANGFVVAARDTGPFEAAGITFIDPWNA